jgi:pimeloyl-ACP methyl ester carboxylesterase
MGSNSDWLPGDVIANGIKIHYYRTGGDKPPFVLAHGFSDSGLCWTRVARVLAESYDLIMADARGHGLSDAPEGGYTSQEHAADLAGLIEALGLDRPTLMGHSMGASTVAATAVCYPELAACAVLEDPPWFAEDSPRFRERAGLTPEERQAQVAKHSHHPHRGRRTQHPAREIRALCPGGHQIPGRGISISIGL